MWNIAIGAPVEKEDVRSTYRLTVRYMTGDADGFETEHYDFKDVEDLKLNLTVLNTYNSIGWNNQCDIKTARDWYKLGGVTNPRANDLTQLQQTFIEFGENVPYETGYDSDRQASPYNWCVTYFDADGVERQTSIIDADGKPFATNRK